MHSSINPYACFDSLLVVKKAADTIGDVASGEIHLLCYLACLLSLYKKKPVSNWQYLFGGTRNGVPFSYEIDKAVSIHLQRGYIIEVKGRLSLTSSGSVELSLWNSLQQNMSREIFIDGACSSLLAFPIGIVRDALSQEAELRNAFSLQQNRILLDERGPTLEHLYKQFEMLSIAIGIDINDLMVPAVVWLRYLSQVSLDNLQKEGKSGS